VTTILWILAVIAILALLLVRKVRRDAIRQDGKRVGSALGWLPTPDGTGVCFTIVRGEPAFQETQPFEYQGRTFVMVSHEGYDDRSSVLRRFLDVTCRMLPPGRS